MGDVPLHVLTSSKVVINNSVYIGVGKDHPTDRKR